MGLLVLAAGWQGEAGAPRPATLGPEALIQEMGTVTGATSRLGGQGLIAELAAEQVFWECAGRVPVILSTPKVPAAACTPSEETGAAPTRTVLRREGSTHAVA